MESCTFCSNFLTLPRGNSHENLVLYFATKKTPVEFDIRKCKFIDSAKSVSLPTHEGVPLKAADAVTFCKYVTEYLETGNPQLKDTYLIISSKCELGKDFIITSKRDYGKDYGKALMITSNSDGTGDNFLLTVVKFVNGKSNEVDGEIRSAQVLMNTNEVQAITEAIQNYLVSGFKPLCWP